MADSLSFDGGKTRSSNLGLSAFFPSCHSTLTMSVPKLS